MDSLITHLQNWLVKGRDWATSPRGQRTGWISAIAVVVFGVGAWFGVPPLVHSLATHQASEWMERPVTLGKVSFNPYTLKLDVQQLHIGERGSDQPFVDVGQLEVNLSWSSLFRLAAVVDSITVVKPQIHIVRTAEQRFNFTDLIEKANKDPDSDSKTHFALHNIKVSDGDISFDDQVTHTQHRVEKLQLGIPFIANLPSATKIDVQPLLQMVVDGSPFNIGGKTRPFAETHESVIDVKLDQLDLTRYLGYVPVQLPVKIPQGFLSTNLQVHFIATQPQVMISLSGDIALDKLKITDRKDAPLLDLKHAGTYLADVQPLRSIVHLNNIGIDGLTTYLALNRDGSTNLDALSSPSAPAKADQKSAKKSEPFDLSIASASLENGSVQFTDRRGAKPASTSLDAIRLKLLKLNTLGKTPANATLDLRVADGSLSVQAKLLASEKQASADIALKQINLAAFQPFLQQQLNGTLKSGLLDAQAKFVADLGEKNPKMQLLPASATIQDFELRSGKNNEAPLRWQNLKLGLDLLDLNEQKAVLSEISADGLNLLARRNADGSINFSKLVRSSTTAKPAVPKTAAPSKPWEFSISKIALNKAGLRFLDDAAPSPVAIEITPLNLSLQNISSDLSKPAKLDLSGDLPRKGHFRINGDVAPSPLKADLQIDTQQLDLAALGAYVSKLNATIASAALTSKARLKISKNKQDQLQLSYSGNATLGRVRVLDKITDDAFVNWNALSANGIKVHLDGDKPLDLHIDALALSDFFARLIMSPSGKLNLQDIMVADAQSATSITQEAPTTPAPASTATPSPASDSSAAQSPPANISLGQITMQGGQVRYTDNFIKPNYTATISSIAGKVGAFGTQGTAPADVLLQAQFEHNAPLTISGSINPLAPMAMVDLSAKASSVELTDMTSYSTKYAGYPLTKGKLSFDVHYKLDQGNLRADNHIYIDQLTFGDHVDGPDATKLPVRLAVSLLKDSNGVIDLHVPVSGSVSDPEFSLGGVILRAFVNLIAKAALSPFSLLSSAFGGGDELSFVVFDPGLAVLTPDAITHLETMSKALADRPALKLDISGRVDPELDTPGLREAMVEQRVRRQMIRDVVGKGSSVDTSTLQVPPESYDKYLKKAYDAESFTKPRNFIGLAKTLPSADMKKLMLTNMPVSDSDLQQLAEQRAEVVRQWLAAKINPDRLFVVAPKLDAKGIDSKDKTTRVDFALK